MHASFHLSSRPRSIRLCQHEWFDASGSRSGHTARQRPSHSHRMLPRGHREDANRSGRYCWRCQSRGSIPPISKGAVLEANGSVRSSGTLQTRGQCEVDAVELAPASKYPALRGGASADKGRRQNSNHLRVTCFDNPSRRHGFGAKQSLAQHRYFLPNHAPPGIRPPRPFWNAPLPPREDTLEVGT